MVPLAPALIVAAPERVTSNKPLVTCSRVVIFAPPASTSETLIPAIAIPVSLIGTFAALLAMGFTINTISLFGLILAIGVVVVAGRLPLLAFPMMLLSLCLALAALVAFLFGWNGVGGNGEHRAVFGC